MQHYRLIALSTAMLAIAQGAAAQERNDSFKWTAGIDAGRTIYVRNLNGAIRVEPASGATAEVRAEKEWRRGNPNDVEIKAEKTSRGDILVCAIYVKRNTRCDESGYNVRGGESWSDRNDISIEFTILLPKGVQLDGSTVNGALHVAGATASVKASTVNGGIEASSTSGPVSAKTVNGNIRVRTGTIGDGSTEYSTVNGNITLELPESLNANVELSTVNGSVTSDDFAISVRGRIDHRSLAGKIGQGGPTLKVSTVNGSIRLQKR